MRVPLVLLVASSLACSGGSSADDAGRQNDAASPNDVASSNDSVVMTECGQPEDRVYLWSPEDLLALAGCTSFRGSLELTNTQLVDVEALADLRTVGGVSTCSGTGSSPAFRACVHW